LLFFIFFVLGGSLAGFYLLTFSHKNHPASGYSFQVLARFRACCGLSITIPTAWALKGQTKPYFFAKLAKRPHNTPKCSGFGTNATIKSVFLSQRYLTRPNLAAIFTDILFLHKICITFVATSQDGAVGSSLGS
jgi:hypothetical protein